MKRKQAGMSAAAFGAQSFHAAHDRVQTMPAAAGPSDPIAELRALLDEMRAELDGSMQEVGHAVESIAIEVAALRGLVQAAREPEGDDEVEP